jgi:hypothetical protein
MGMILLLCPLPIGHYVYLYLDSLLVVALCFSSVKAPGASRDDQEGPMNEELKALVAHMYSLSKQSEFKSYRHYLP